MKISGCWEFARWIDIREECRELTVGFAFDGVYGSELDIAETSS